MSNLYMTRAAHTVGEYIIEEVGTIGKGTQIYWCVHNKSAYLSKKDEWVVNPALDDFVENHCWVSFGEVLDFLKARETQHGFVLDW